MVPRESVSTGVVMLIFCCRLFLPKMKPARSRNVCDPWATGSDLPGEGSKVDSATKKGSYLRMPCSQVHGGEQRISGLYG